MNPINEYARNQSRRHFLFNSGVCLGGAALASLMSGERATSTQPGSTAHGGLPDLPHFTPRARRCIYLFMSEGPSQMEMFDYKPVMEEWYDRDLPPSVRGDQRLTTMTSGQTRFPIAPSIYSFRQCGQSGTWVSNLLPHFQTVIDDVALIKSVHTEAINHDPAITYFCTGSQIPGKPSMGSWLSYGLGSENQNLPAFIVLHATWTGRPDAQALFNRLWGSGFLPSRHQGVLLRTQIDPVLYLNNPPGVSSETRQNMLDALSQLNQEHFEQMGDPETQARIAQYEMAFRMQTSVPELMDLSAEPDWIFDLYGPESRTPGTFAYNCLLARRMMERDVRFVQIFHRGWDQHANLTGDLPKQCRDIDQGCAGLIKDLKARGLLDDTLVVWGGEFGRTIYCQGPLSHVNYGRDHHPRCFTMWMAGAGIKPGISYGETDEFSYNIVNDPVHVRDIQATMLHQMGIDHERFTYPYQGLEQRLTGVEPAAAIEGIMGE